MGLYGKRGVFGPKLGEKTAILGGFGARKGVKKKRLKRVKNGRCDGGEMVKNGVEGGGGERGRRGRKLG